MNVLRPVRQGIQYRINLISRGHLAESSRIVEWFRIPLNLLEKWLPTGLYVEMPPFSFVDSRPAAVFDAPFDVNIELQRRLRKAYLEFREPDLRILLADLRSSIRLPS